MMEGNDFLSHDFTDGFPMDSTEHADDSLAQVCLTTTFSKNFNIIEKLLL